MSLPSGSQICPVLPPGPLEGIPVELGPELVESLVVESVATPLLELPACVGTHMPPSDPLSGGKLYPVSQALSG
jgi:hypothetical protein